MLKTWWTINFVATVSLIIVPFWAKAYFTWDQEPPSLLILLFMSGIIAFLVGQISIIHLHGIAKSEDQIDEKWTEYYVRERELDKLIDFMKTKAFNSTVATKEEIRAHMGWTNKEIITNFDNQKL